jgi:hydrocephalus-inducing protein
MSQARTYSFPLTNSSTARMDFRFTVTHLNGDPDSSGLYSISPEGGMIEPGASTTVIVRFAPKEVEECGRMLTCHIPHLDAACVPLVRHLNGRVLRPLCHFELSESDYLSGEARGMEGGAGGHYQASRADSNHWSITHTHTHTQSCMPTHTLTNACTHIFRWSAHT